MRARTLGLLDCILSDFKKNGEPKTTNFKDEIDSSVVECGSVRSVEY